MEKIVLKEAQTQTLHNYFLEKEKAKNKVIDFLDYLKDEYDLDDDFEIANGMIALVKGCKVQILTPKQTELLKDKVIEMNHFVNMLNGFINYLNLEYNSDASYQLDINNGYFFRNKEMKEEKNVKDSKSKSRN
ncbi:MAG: hypothetical protein WC476_01065 [Phycisphaerae bacterium]|jgi:hypothetical protein